METYGHDFIERHIVESVQEGKQRGEALVAEKGYTGERASDMIERCSEHDSPCVACGRTLYFNMVDGVPAMVRTSGPPYVPPADPAQEPDAWRQYLRTMSYPDEPEVCDFTFEDIVIPFTSTSGRLVLANDLRQNWSGARVPMWKYEGYAGERVYYKHMAERYRLLYGGIGNTHVWFVATPDGLQVHTPADAMTDEDYYRLNDTAIHHFSSELWAFNIMDADDLPPDPRDSFDRPVGYYDLPEGPGDYIYTYRHRLVKHWADLHPGAKTESGVTALFATIRKA